MFDFFQIIFWVAIDNFFSNKNIWLKFHFKIQKWNWIESSMQSYHRKFTKIYRNVLIQNCLDQFFKTGMDQFWSVYIDKLLWFGLRLEELLFGNAFDNQRQHTAAEACREGIVVLRKKRVKNVICWKKMLFRNFNSGASLGGADPFKWSRRILMGVIDAWAVKTWIYFCH